jgi:protein SCO1/2
MSARLPWIIVAVAIAAALGLWLGARVAPPAGAAPKAALVYPAPRDVPPFKLAKSDGAPLTEADLRGGWSLMFFGFTHCADVCPTTLATLKQVEAQLAPASVKVIFVSVDPERDTPQALGEYVGYFSPRFIAATGDPASLQSFASSVGAVFMKSPQPSGDYSMDHTASVLVFDPQGRLHALFRPPLDANAIADDLRTFAKG